MFYFPAVLLPVQPHTAAYRTPELDVRYLQRVRCQERYANSVLPSFAFVGQKSCCTFKMLGNDNRHRVLGVSGRLSIPAFAVCPEGNRPFHSRCCTGHGAPSRRCCTMLSKTVRSTVLAAVPPPLDEPGVGQAPVSKAGTAGRFGIRTDQRAAVGAQTSARGSPAIVIEKTATPPHHAARTADLARWSPDSALVPNRITSSADGSVAATDNTSTNAETTNPSAAYGCCSASVATNAVWCTANASNVAGTIQNEATVDNKSRRGHRTRRARNGGNRASDIVVDSPVLAFGYQNQ